MEKDDGGLTVDQLELIRAVSNAYGKVTVDYDTAAVKELVGITLDSQDLKWTADVSSNGKDH